MYHLSRRPKQCILLVSGNTLQQVKFKYLSTLRWYSRVTEVGTKRLWHTNSESKRSSAWTLLLWGENRSFQSSQSFQFSNRSLFRSSSVDMNLE